MERHHVLNETVQCVHGVSSRCYDDGMAELEPLDALRRRNKHLLETLKKQNEKLQQRKLSDEVACRSSVSEAFPGGSDRAPLTERNGELTASKAQTPPQSTDTPVEQFVGDCEIKASDQHQHQPSSVVTAYGSRLLDGANSRWQGQNRTTRLLLSKPEPLTRDTKQREVDSTTTLASVMENDTASERQHIRPLLGYDWIAGLLDTESSLTERPDQFFSDLSSFRQLNRNECVQSLKSEPELLADLESSVLESKEPLQPSDKHQCTFCYKINSRLFAAPLEPQAACPVCKTPRFETQPAFIRVSIPRSALLPSYKHKAHRRSSFDSSDSLGLPSHCLSGWANPSVNSGSQMSSLDLRGSLTKPAASNKLTPSSSNHQLDSSLSKKSRDQRSNLLLNVLPRFHFQQLEPKISEPHCSPSALY